MAGSALLVAAVAYVDFVTGTELRVFPLYFLPVLAVSLRLGSGPGSPPPPSARWPGSCPTGCRTDGPPAVTAVNLLVMALAFASVALLAAAQRRSLARERALSRTDN